jgi:hypothetical protein
MDSLNCFLIIFLGELHLPLVKIMGYVNPLKAV